MITEAASSAFEGWAVRTIEHLSVEERRARGKAAREQEPPAGHAGWIPAKDRPDPVALLEEQDTTREADWCRCVTGG